MFSLEGGRSCWHVRGAQGTAVTAVAEDTASLDIRAFRGAVAAAKRNGCGWRSLRERFYSERLQQNRMPLAGKRTEPSLQESSLMSYLFSRLGVHHAPAEVYHYTSPAGLLGIVTQAEIWATDTRYLNDSQEFNYTIDRANVLLNKAAAQNDSEDLGVVRRALDVAPGAHLFAASFSAQRDLLSQWRAYCPAGGFSVGFAPGDIMETTGLFLMQCVYDTEEQDQLLSLVIEYFQKHSPSAEEQRAERYRLAGREAVILSAFLLLAAAFKAPAFAEEQEYRLVQTSKHTDYTAEYRQGRSGIMPFIRLPVKAEHEATARITSVVVGPSPHADLALEAVRGFLKSQRLEARVDRSSVPVRSW